MKIAYCIFGQLRSFKKCWPTMKQHLEPGDFFIQAQRCFPDDEEMIQLVDDQLVYSEILTKEEYLVGFDIENMKHISDNWCGPMFGRPSCNMCIYAQYYRLGKALENKTYDKIVILRSDMYFVLPLVHIKLEENTLYHADVESWGGFNPFILTFKGTMSHILKIPYEVLSVPTHPVRSQFPNSMNIEKLLKEVWRNFKKETFPIPAFLTATCKNDVTTWSIPMFDSKTGFWYKYEDDYRNCIKRLETT